MGLFALNSFKLSSGYFERAIHIERKLTTYCEHGKGVFHTSESKTLLHKPLTKVAV